MSKGSWRTKRTDLKIEVSGNTEDGLDLKLFETVSAMKEDLLSEDERGEEGGRGGGGVPTDDQRTHRVRMYSEMVISSEDAMARESICCVGGLTEM